MKKIILIAVTALFFQACAEKEAGGMSERARKNSESMNGIIRAIEAKDFDKLDQYMAADIVDHAAMGGPARGIEGVKTDLRQQSSFSNDGKIEVLKELADDDYVMSWLKFTGTVAEDQMGMKKGDKYEMTSVEIGKFNAEGKATEHWTFMDPADMAKMMSGMGQMPADTSGAMPADTTK